MDTAALDASLVGALAVANLFAALLFLRYWRSSRDRFFLFLVASFLLEAINRTVTALEPAPAHEAIAHYVTRLAAYLLIVLAIWDKNRSGPG